MVKQNKYLVSTLLLMFIFCTISFSQSPESVFASGFPLVYKYFQIDKHKEIDKSQVSNFQNEYKKLTNAILEVSAFEKSSSGCSVLNCNDLKLLSNRKNLFAFKEMLTSNAQTIKVLLKDKSRFGADSADCMRNSSFLEQYLALNDFTNAYPYWRTMFEFYPIYSKTIYIKGLSIIDYKIVKCQNVLEKQKWIDTLLLVYDQRIRYFGDDLKFGKGYILSRKAFDLIKYSKDSISQSYLLLKESIKLQGVNSEDIILQYFIKQSVDLAAKKSIDTSVVFLDYLTVNQIYQGKEKSVDIKSAKNIETSKTTIDKIIYSCKELNNKYLSQKIDSSIMQWEGNLAVLKSVLSLFELKGYTNSGQYSLIIEKIQKLEPTSSGAYRIARYYFNKPEYLKANEFYEQALAIEKSDSLKSVYFYELALSLEKLQENEQSRDMASKAINLRTGFGAPYVLIASLYSESADKCGFDDFEKKAINWLIVDKLNLAKISDKSLTNQVNKLIEIYTSRFPLQSDGIRAGVTQGQSYKVKCWINETTSARFLR
jgi:hypothetical protein